MMIVETVCCGLILAPERSKAVRRGLPMATGADRQWNRTHIFFVLCEELGQAARRRVCVLPPPGGQSGEHSIIPSMLLLMTVCFSTIQTYRVLLFSAKKKKHITTFFRIFIVSKVCQASVVLGSQLFFYCQSPWRSKSQSRTTKAPPLNHTAIVRQIYTKLQKKIKPLIICFGLAFVPFWLPRVELEVAHKLGEPKSNQGMSSTKASRLCEAQRHCCWIRSLFLTLF